MYTLPNYIDNAGVTLYAKWAINTFTLTYTAGENGSITGTTPQTVYYNASGSAVTAVPAANYHFVDWSDSPTANPRTDTAVASDISVTANFAIDTHTVTFNSNGGSAVSPITDVNYGATVTLPSVPTKTGYTFAGWFSDDTTFAVPFLESTAVTDTITIYAKWTADTYTVTFDANGNTGGTKPSDQTKTHDVTLVLAANTGTLVKTGYTFAGWNTLANGLGTSYAAGANCFRNTHLAD